MRLQPQPIDAVARTRPPAKLNLFLELLGRRSDGFHEIDTVMVPIDWCDELRLQRTPDRGIDLHVHWEPSKQEIADCLGVTIGSDTAERLLGIPDDETNLVHRALKRFTETFQVEGGFRCDLAKQIPAGAGMGGASSDAASALRAAAKLWGIPHAAPQLASIAAEIGSDVRFFLGMEGETAITAARATGRGELLEKVNLTSVLAFVVVFPALSLATGKVYSISQIPSCPQTSCRLIDLLESGEVAQLGSEMMNRLTEPAKKLAPRISEVLESLWQLGLTTSQLTGSGSACFAIAGSSDEAIEAAEQAHARLVPGALVRKALSTQVPARVDIMPPDIR